MKFYLISDNMDTLTGMRLAGIEGEVAHTAPQLRQALSTTARQAVTPYLLPTVLPQVMGQYQQLLD